MADSSQERGSVVERLFLSFMDLERAINGARASLSKKNSVPKEIFERLDSYNQILTDQRRLTHKLADHITAGNTAEVSRHVGLINAMSAMIIDDARGILAALSPETVSTKPEDEINYC